MKAGEGEPRRLNARVVEGLPNALYRVELESEGRGLLTAHASGAAGLVRIRPGDAVVVELLPYDATRARIVGRRER